MSWFKGISGRTAAPRLIAGPGSGLPDSAASRLSAGRFPGTCPGILDCWPRGLGGAIGTGGAGRGGTMLRSATGAGGGIGVTGRDGSGSSPSTGPSDGRLDKSDSGSCQFRETPLWSGGGGSGWEAGGSATYTPEPGFAVSTPSETSWLNAVTAVLREIRNSCMTVRVGGSCSPGGSSPLWIAFRI